jgi:hypothetical protein
VLQLALRNCQQHTLFIIGYRRGINMLTIRNLRRISLSLIACLVALMLPVAPINAAMIGTDQIVSSAQISQERDRIRVFLQRDDVRQMLRQQGVDASDALARVGSMTNDEVSLVAGKLDQLPAGGDWGIIGALVFVFIVLLITDILGLTKVFPFTRPVR